MRKSLTYRSLENGDGEWEGNWWITVRVVVVVCVCVCVCLKMIILLEWHFLECNW